MADKIIMALECKVYVGNLEDKGCKIELERVFSYYGRLKKVLVTTTGYAFVEFEDVTDAKNAVHALHGTTICGVTARVQMSSGMSRRGRNRFGGGSDGRRGGSRHEDKDEGRSRRYERRSISRSRSPYGGKERERSRSPRSDRSNSGSPAGRNGRSHHSRSSRRSRSCSTHKSLAWYRNNY